MTSHESTTVGFVGLGDQGEPMVQRMLDAGYQVVIHARKPEQAAELVAQGAAWADSIGELGARSDVLGVCVGDDDDVDEVVAAALPSMREGSVIVIHSTVHPDLCRRLGERGAARGVHVVDAPLSGGRKGAIAGTMTVMVGGDAGAVELVRPMLETFGRAILHVGPLGGGQIVKLINNYLSTAQLHIAAQTADLIARVGLDVNLTLQALAASTSGTNHVRWLLDDWIVNDEGRLNVFLGKRHKNGPSRGVELLTKDVTLAREILAGAGATQQHLDADVSRGLERAADEAEYERCRRSSHRA